MSKAKISAGQARSLIGSFTTDTPWDEIEANVQPFIELSPEERGQRFAAFLRNGCQLIIGEPKIVTLDPSRKFNPTKFIGAGWTVWKGPASGDGLEGEEAIDMRAQALTSLDLSTLLLESCLKKGEGSIGGEEKFTRLSTSKNIQLGGNAFLTLREDYQQNKENSHLEWLRRNCKVTYLDFFGLVLRNPNGDRYVLYLYWYGDVWHWSYYWLGRDWGAGGLSAGVAS